jgi:hypothetical protein
MRSTAGVYTQLQILKAASGVVSSDREILSEYNGRKGMQKSVERGGCDIETAEVPVQ